MQNRHHEETHTQSHHMTWKWDISRMSVTEIEELKSWGQSHSISWAQIQAYNDCFKSKSGKPVTYDSVSDIVSFNHSQLR